jgi:hypothetical protein
MEKICNKLIFLTVFIVFKIPIRIIGYILFGLLYVSPILIYIAMNFFLIAHVFLGGVLHKPSSYETGSLVFYYIFCFLYVIADILFTLYGLKYLFRKK